MIKISHEIPIALFNSHDLINDYPYALAHLLMSDTEHYSSTYAHFYKDRLGDAEFSILDNSCLDYYSNVLLADGSKMKLGAIVKKKLSIEVASYNKETKKIENKKVTDWFDNGMEKTDWYKIVYQHSKLNRKDRVGVRCTGNHKIYTKDRGYVQARDLKVGDKVCSDELLFNEYQRQLILGTLIGDGSIKKNGYKGTSRSVMRIGHSDKQEGYVGFKHNILTPFVKSIHARPNDHPKGFNKRKGAKPYLFETRALMQLNEIQTLLYSDDNKVKSHAPVIEKLDWFGFCIWYLDDGSTNRTSISPVINISLAKISEADRINIPLVLKKRFGLKSQIKDYGNNVLLIFDKSNTEKIFSEIESFIPECMNYKIHPLCFKGVEKIDIPNNTSDVFEVKIEEIINKGVIRKKKYDITVEGNHNYFVDNILVSNCYELGHPIDDKILHQLGEEYMPSHIVIPDVYQNMQGTIDSVTRYIREYGQNSYPGFFAVVQGTTLEEYIRCYEFFLTQSSIDIVGINFKTLSDGKGRQDFLQYLLETGKGVMKKIHLLGCENASEFLEYNNEVMRMVHSVDTSAPIVHGWNLNKFTKEPFSYEKPSEKIADNLYKEISESQMDMIAHNVKMFRSYIH